MSWAGEEASAGWFDTGREFTELWHHQAQIRLAVDAGALDDPRFLAAVLDVAVRGLPHAFRDVQAGTGDAIALDIAGASGGRWTLSREATRWTLWRGEPAAPVTRVRLSDEAAWKLLFNALSDRPRPTLSTSRAVPNWAEPSCARGRWSSSCRAARRSEPTHDTRIGTCWMALLP